MNDEDRSPELTSLHKEASSELEPIEYVTLTDQVYQLLKKRILTQEIPLGARVRDEDLAEQLGVSRTPVREALQRLAEDGLVEVVPRSATRVRTFTREDIEEIFDLRIALESMAAKKSAGLLSDEEIEELVELHRWARDAMEEGESEPAREFDEQLHRTLIQGCGNQRLQKIMSRINDYVTLFRQIGAMSRTRDGWTYLHDEIVDALRAREPERCRRLIADHIEVAKQQTLKDLKGHRALATDEED